MDTVWMLALIVIVGYVLSVFVHPYVKCGRCKGLGRHHGALFSYSQRPCHHCAGTGRTRRFGAYLLGRGKRTRPTGRVQPPTRAS